MKQIFNIILLLFIFFVNVSLSARKIHKTVKSKDDALSWFNKYGYNPCLNSQVQCSVSFTSLLKYYQNRFHLKITGKLDEATKKHMNRPRCGNHDKRLAELNTESSLFTTKWSRSPLTYVLRGYPTQINEAETKKIIREAFHTWFKYIPLTIEEACTTCEADFVIDFVSYDHLDSYPFDGPGGTLAHAFYPKDGRVHFDKDETWTESFSDLNTNLYLVAVHEIGHALGLDHAYDEKSIMYPSYQLMPKASMLPAIDRKELEKLYGRKHSSSSSSSSSPSTTTGYTTTRSHITVPSGNLHPRCRVFLDAAFEHPDGTLHTFNAGVLWRYLPDEQRWENRAKTFRYIYPHLPTRLSAGVYDSRRQALVFFTNKYVYQYNTDKTHATLRKRQRLATNLRNSITGAIYYDNEIHVITQQTIRLFHLDHGPQRSNERDLSNEFPHFTGTVIKAFSYGHLHHFFTIDRLAYVWNDQLNRWETFGKPMETNWFACSGDETYFERTTYVTTPYQRPTRRKHHHHHHRHHRHHHHHYRHRPQHHNRYN